MDRVVISLGGSVVVPSQVDVEYLQKFREFARSMELPVIVVGGGATARQYQDAARELNFSNAALDWIGIQSTRLNAQLVALYFGVQDVVTDPEGELPEQIVAGGWKPGWSTDYVAATLAARLDVHTILNISNVSHVYTADPKVDRDAQPKSEMTWDELLAIIGHEWQPGLHAPFDPVAAKLCKEKGIKVLMVGKGLENAKAALAGETFVGTLLR